MSVNSCVLMYFVLFFASQQEFSQSAVTSSSKNCPGTITQRAKIGLARLYHNRGIPRTGSLPARNASDI